MHTPSHDQEAVTPAQLSPVIKAKELKEAQKRWSHLKEEAYVSITSSNTSSIDLKEPSTLDQSQFFQQMHQAQIILNKPVELISAIDIHTLTTTLDLLESWPPLQRKNSWTLWAKNGLWLSFLLLVVLLLRALWLEHYYIPTGSMRPTYREGDHPLVLKSGFSLNHPWKNKGHLFLEPNALPFGRTIVFTSEGLPYCDNQTKLFGVLPTYKKYVKRCMGKPGDQVFFYGGRIYQTQQRLRPQQDPYAKSTLEDLEHIPYLYPYFPAIKEGKQWNLHYLGSHLMSFEESHFGSDALNATFMASKSLFGMLNFAQVKLILPDQVSNEFLPKRQEKDPSTQAYLQVLYIKDPSTSSSTLLRSSGTDYIQLPLEAFYLPLVKEQIAQLWKGIYTSRFKVYQGKAYGLATDPLLPSQEGVPLPNIPDGCYEFLKGRAYQIDWGNRTSLLPESHPLYDQHSLKRLQWLFQFGLAIHPRYAPSADNPHFPTRYIYWRHGELCLFNQPLSFPQHYIPTDFQDSGLPDDPSQWLSLENGFLALGDNHAQSADSRIFGLVPPENIQGTLIAMVWPLLLDDRYPTIKERLEPTQPNLPLTPVNFILHGVLVLGAVLYLLAIRKKQRAIDLFYQSQTSSYHNSGK
jgi:signal peptidase I